MTIELTTEQVIQLVMDEMAGREPTILGAEADRLREVTRHDIQICEANGWILDIPHEWGDVGDIDENGVDQSLIAARKRAIEESKQSPEGD